jgi:hypothetical protein
MTAKSIAILTAGLLATAPAWAASDHALEPCINGEVSASGLYPTQAAEDNRYEACLNGEVSASGSYPTQALEDRALARAATTAQVAAR